MLDCTGSDSVLEDTFVDAATTIYCEHLLGPASALEDQICKCALEHGVQHMQITRLEATFLKWIIASGPCEIGIELGSLVGYSASVLASVMPPQGMLYTVEADTELAQLARKNLSNLKVGPSVEVVNAEALQFLGSHAAPSEVDFIFIDAKWSEYPQYLAWVVRHIKPGGLIVAHDVHTMGFICHDPKSAEVFAASIQQESRPTCFEFEGSTQERQEHLRSAVRAIQQFNNSLTRFSRGKCAFFSSSNGLIFARMPYVNE